MKIYLILLYIFLKNFLIKPKYVNKSNKFGGVEGAGAPLAPQRVHPCKINPAITFKKLKTAIFHAVRRKYRNNII